MKFERSPLGLDGEIISVSVTIGCVMTAFEYGPSLAMGWWASVLFMALLEDRERDFLRMERIAKSLLDEINGMDARG